LTDEEYAKLLRFLKEPANWDVETGVTDLLMRTGMRQGELVRLKFSDFDLERRMILIRPLKGSELRVSKLPEEVWDRIFYLVILMEKERVDTFGGLFCASNNPRFQTRQVQRLVKKCLDRALGKGHGFTTHSLRHTYALKCLKRFDNDLLKVKMAMGHVSIQSTEQYLKYIRSEDLADDIMEAVGE
jgi:integrase